MTERMIVMFTGRIKRALEGLGIPQTPELTDKLLKKLLWVEKMIEILNPDQIEPHLRSVQITALIIILVLDEQGLLETPEGRIDAEEVEG